MKWIIGFMLGWGFGTLDQPNPNLIKLQFFSCLTQILNSVCHSLYKKLGGVELGIYPNCTLTQNKACEDEENVKWIWFNCVTPYSS